jgi:hypothetical protein
MGDIDPYLIAVVGEPILPQSLHWDSKSGDFLEKD